MYTNIRVDGQAQAREGRGLRQRCKFVVPSLLQFFLGGEICFQEPAISPSLVAKKRARQIEKKIEILFRAYFFLGKRGKGNPGPRKGPR